MKMNAGMIIGLLGGAIGIIVAVIAVIATKSYFALIIIALVGGIIGTTFWKVLFRPMMISNRLAKVGVGATAIVKEVRDTGVTVNNAPQIKLLLEVTPPNGLPYLVETKQLISRLQTAMYQVGSTLPVLIDPNDRDYISLDYDGTGSRMNAGSSGSSNLNSVPVGPWAGMSKQDAERKLVDIDAKNKEIFAYGTSSRAIVTRYTWLGMYINGENPAVEIEVQVLPVDRPAFAANTIGVIMEQSVPKFQVGEEIYVKYDPNNTSKVTIEHS